ncbi:MAG: S41 family peptidase [Chloroflexi bacterium]|nr:S41 family peptidase [Chloroflexota bacterium]
MKAVVRILIAFVVAVILVSGAFLGGYATSQIVLSRNAPTPIAPLTTTSNDNTPSEFKADMPVFWEAWNLINENFYTQPVDQDKMTYGAVGGMVDALGDVHTAFVDPKRAAYLQTQLQGSFEGIGAQVQMVNGRLLVVTPFKGSPAEKAGLQAGDVILKVDGQLIVNMTVEDAVALIRGPKGTEVHLTIQRGSNPAFDVTITRSTIDVPEVESKMLENDTIAYVQLSEFGEKAKPELRKALSDALAKKPKALIFDLRGNPGGYLTTAIEVASEFLPQDQVVLVEKFKNGDKRLYKTQGSGLATKIPMVLLVNEGSASASEILAAALHDYKRATIIGQKTFGKGSVQTVHTLSDDSQLRVTIANFYSPNETSINEVGISPDIEVPDPTPFERSQGIDVQLQKAIDLIKSGELGNLPKNP